MKMFITDSEKEKLIAAVQSYPCLYDCTRESYHCRAARSNAWSEVAKLCDCKGNKTMLLNSFAKFGILVLACIDIASGVS